MGASSDALMKLRSRFNMVLSRKELPKSIPGWWPAIRTGRIETVQYYKLDAMLHRQHSMSRCPAIGLRSGFRRRRRVLSF
jgi:hypothetical protein